MVDGPPGSVFATFQKSGVPIRKTLKIAVFWNLGKMATIGLKSHCGQSTYIGWPAGSLTIRPRCLSVRWKFFNRFEGDCTMDLSRIGRRGFVAKSIGALGGLALIGGMGR